MTTVEHTESHVLHPNDEHNQKLRDNVHGAAMLGARSALIERHLMGGDCLVTGCVPSKTLIMSAHVAHAARKAG